MQTVRSWLPAHAPVAAVVGALAALAIGAPGAAQAQPRYPAETIRIIVPFGPTGGPDFSVRAFAQVLQDIPLQDDIKPTIRVENRPGANSIIGTRAVATAAPDGYTLLGASSGFSTIGVTTAQPGFDPLNDFAPVGLIARAAGYLLVVSAKSPHRSMADLVAAAKRSDVFYGSPGIGNTLHLAAALFAERTGAPFKHVPYPNSADVVLAVARGEVAFAFSTPPAILGLLQSGDLRALGYAGSQPLAEMPAVPLISSFARDFRVAEPWTGILAPARTPEPVIAILSAGLQRAVATPRYKTMLEPGSYWPYANAPRAFRTFLEENIADWRAAADAAGVSPGGKGK